MDAITDLREELINDVCATAGSFDLEEKIEKIEAADASMIVYAVERNRTETVTGGIVRALREAGTPYCERSRVLNQYREYVDRAQAHKRAIADAR